LRFVYAYNKNGKKYKVLVDDHTSIRLTKANGKRVNMYFNTTFLKDSCLYGNKSHFINLPVGPYKITDLKRIEIQSASRFVAPVK
ncbi:MAG: hypothetical protein ABI378_13650, partial [Chitinophagaceae bacterium]